MPKLDKMCIAILATDGFEQSELLVPRERLESEGAEVSIISTNGGTIRGWDGDNWGETVNVDLALADADADRFHALVLPGGLMNPDQLRTHSAALAFVRAFFDAGKVIAAICHAPWILINAGVVVGRNLTSYPTLRQDLENAGASWHDRAVVIDNGLVTSRSPEDLDDFSAKLIEEICESQRARVA